METRFASESGQASLVGTLVAASLGITALMGTMSLFKASSQAQRTVQSRGDATDLGTSLRMIVDNPALCTKAFWDSEKTPQIAFFNPDDPKLAATKLPFSIHFGDAPLLNLGSRPDPAFSVTSIGLAEVDKSVRSSTASTTTYLVSLSVGLGWDTSLAYRGPNSISQPLYVQTDNTTHQVVACGRNLAGQTAPGTNAPPPSTGVVNCPANQVVIGINKSTGDPICGSFPGGNGGFGGSYVYYFSVVSNSGWCRVANRLTGACTCPQGYVPSKPYTAMDGGGYPSLYLCTHS